MHFGQLDNSFGSTDFLRLAVVLPVRESAKSNRWTFQDDLRIQLSEHDLMSTWFALVKPGPLGILKASPFFIINPRFAALSPLK